MQNRATKRCAETRLKNGIRPNHRNEKAKKGDLIEVFKICRGYDDICEDRFFVRSKSNLRRASTKVT